jgi:hypothetical protein
MSGLTSINGSGWAIITGLVMHLGKVFSCLETPSSIRIPGSVREIGDRAFGGLASLIDLSFEEGILTIADSAFYGCSKLAKAAFPASLIVIEANAFQDCYHLRRIIFAVGSQLQDIGSGAFSNCPLNEVAIPASIAEIDPSAFTDDVWRESVIFEGPPLYSIDAHYIRSIDSRIIFRSVSRETAILIGSNTEVIGPDAFNGSAVSAVLIESGAILREIGSRAFASCIRLTAFKVPESVEIIGDRCFNHCSNMERIEFEGSSRLKRISEMAFCGCRLHWITIPALTEEIDGSAFVNCPWITIRVAPGNLHFRVEGNFLVMSDGKEIVRYFGHDREIVVGKKVRVLRRSCFEYCNQLDKVDFEVGSELERICLTALCDCQSLSIVEIPSSVTTIEESSFEGCTELESCLIAEDSSLFTIGARAFTRCTSLRSFSIPRHVGEIGNNCFDECEYLYRLTVRSSDWLKRVVGDRSVENARDKLGVIASRVGIEFEDGGEELNHPGWISSDDDGGDLP